MMEAGCPIIVSALLRIDVGVVQKLAGPVDDICYATEPYWIVGGLIVSAAIGLLRFWQPISAYLTRVPDAVRVFTGKAQAVSAAQQPPKLIFVVDPQQTWWHLGKQGNAPSMQLVIRGNVSNLGKMGALLLHTHLAGREGDMGHVSVKDTESAYHGKFLLKPSHITEFHLQLFVSPPLAKEGSTFKATVIVVDNFGRSHVLPKVRFRYS